MPRFIIGSSLTAHFDPRRQVEWTRQVADAAAVHPAVLGDLVQPFVIASFPCIPAVAELAVPAGMLIGVPDVVWEEPGTSTDEVTGPELAELGVSLVEIGHEERRPMVDGTDPTAARKVEAAFADGLMPVLRIGEPVDDGAASAIEQCLRQLDDCLDAARYAGTPGSLAVAYEPMWVISGRHSASDAHIRAVASALREAVANDPLLDEARIIYGGSTGPGLLTRIADEVDGLLLGRFALDPAAFEAVLDEAWELGG